MPILTVTFVDTKCIVNLCIINDQTPPIILFNWILQEVNKSVRSILNKITPDNMGALTEKFKSLPIDTMERLEKTIDLVFEKVMYLFHYVITHNL